MIIFHIMCFIDFFFNHNDIYNLMTSSPSFSFFLKNDFSIIYHFIYFHESLKRNNYFYRKIVEVFL